MTAAEAIAAGASYIVVGRPIIGADNPRKAAEAIAMEVAKAASRQLPATSRHEPAEGAGSWKLETGR